jgi:hypothetical protein
MLPARLRPSSASRLHQQPPDQDEQHITDGEKREIIHRVIRG